MGVDGDSGLQSEVKCVGDAKQEGDEYVMVECG